MRQFLNVAGIVPHRFVGKEDLLASLEKVKILYRRLVYVDGIRTSKLFKKKGDILILERRNVFKALMHFLRVCAAECETHIFVKRKVVNKCKSKNIVRTYSVFTYRLLT